jgi:Cu/Ag efflux protein CusF
MTEAKGSPMKTLLKPFLALAAGLALSAGAVAAEYTKGEVKKIDEAQKKLTIKHEELKNLEMPPMTMVFVVADEAMLGKVKVGQTIEFVAERVNGRITVTEIK